MAVKDAKMIHLSNDIDKIHIKQNMYISSYGTKGAEHLTHEIIQNAFDEVKDPDATGSDIVITIDKKYDRLTCKDNSRGFSEKDYPLDIFCTTLQSGSKFYRESGGSSAGEFGVGMCVVNALSDEFKITSYREEEKTTHTITYHEGTKIKDTITKNPKGKHGSYISFIPSKKYLGKDTHIPIEDVCDWIDSLFYLDSVSLKANDIKCKVEIYDGDDLKKVIKYKPKPFVKLLDKLSDNKNASNSLYLHGNETFKEMGKVLEMRDGNPYLIEKKMDKNVHLDVAIRYINESTTIWDTYCNDTNTIEHGTHKDVVEQVYCRYMQSIINKSMSEAEKKRLKIIWDDIRDGLVCVVNMSTNLEVGFIGNAKQKINCPASEQYIAEIVQRELDRIFKEDDALLKQYIKIIKLNCKARLEAVKAKTATKVNSVDNFKAHQMKNYIPCNNTGKNDFREIFIIEGNSAASSVRNA